jgi:hypothetical protein
MVGALLYLRLVSLRNWLASTAARLRQPKYLASALAGAAYFYLVFFRRLLSTRPPAPGAPAGLAGGPLEPGAALVLGAAILFTFVLLRFAYSWIAPAPSPRLRFTEAEIAFLFPAPISRTRLIHFNLLSSQLYILLSSVLLTVVFNRWSFLGGNPAARAVGWWLILSTWNLLGTYSQLAIALRIQRAGGGVRLRVLGALLVLATALAYSTWQRARPPAEAELAGLRPMAAYLVRCLDIGPARTVLAPFEWVVGPFAARGLRAFLLALGPALAIPAALYLAVLRLEVSFAEGSIAQAEQRAQVRTAWRSGTYRGAGAKLKAIRAPFALRDRGRPELAFFWKNLIAIQAWFNLRTFLIILMSFAIVLFANLRGPRSPIGATAPLVLVGAVMVTFYTLLAGPQLFRQDLRSDLVNADILKTYPLAGWQIVLGQILTPTLLMSGVLWLALLTAGWAYSRLPAAPGALSHSAQATLVLCLAAVIPLIVFLQLLVPNGAALLFPAWHQASRNRAAGPEALGQRLIFVFGQLFAVLLALLPAALLGFLLFFASFWLLGIPAALVIATAGVVAVVAGELCVGVWWLGGRFERLDIAQELRP